MAYEELSTVQDTAIIREKNKMLELVVPTLEEANKNGINVQSGDGSLIDTAHISEGNILSI